MRYAVLENVVAELAERVVPAAVVKIYQPGPDLLVFRLRAGRETLSLLLSAEPGRGSIHLTGTQFLNPSRPPRFCQLLRARISRLTAIDLIGRDRIVALDCRGRGGRVRLILELTGRNGNMALVDDQGLIVDVLKRVESEEAVRMMLPGRRYVCPESDSQQRTGRQNGSEQEKPAGMSWNHYVEKLYNGEGGSIARQDYVVYLHRTVAREKKKLLRRLKNIAGELSRQENFLHFRQCGDLILAQMAQVRKGMTQVVVDNYYLDPVQPVTIQLDPRLSPQENAGKYFTRAGKAERGVEHSKRRLRESGQELEWLEQLEYQLNDLVKKTDIEEIADELRAAGLLKDKNQLYSRRTQRPAALHSALSPSGFKVMWGRNNRQNDELSTKYLKQGDLWFHVRNAPGCHVVLKSGAPGQSFSDDDVLFAAAIAAGHSKLKSDTKVEVMKAEAGAVHKPKGAKPGLVTLSRYTTLLVAPEVME